MNLPPMNGLPGQLLMDDLQVERGRVTATMPVTTGHLAPIGRLHAGAAITLADTACGYGCLAHLPEDATGFATSTITSHHVGTAAAGDTLAVEAHLLHAGRTTQVRDATVTRTSDGRAVAVVRVLQQILAAAKGSDHE